jgi:hypothetical protein
MIDIHLKGREPRGERGLPVPIGAHRRLEAIEAELAAGRLKPAHLLALQAFEVAARVGSFKQAAQILNLTPSAISHRIRNLEAALAAPLFRRAPCRRAHGNRAGRLG